jgi:serine-protein kinase ATM
MSVAEKPQESPGLRSIRPSLATDMQILDSCSSETERVLAKWSEWIGDRSQNLLPDMMVTVASLCIVNDILVSRQDDRNKRRADALRKINETLIKSFTGFLALPECDQDSIDAILALIGDFLSPIRILQSTDDSHDAAGSIMPFALHLSRALNLRRAARKSVTNIDDDDLMGIDDGFDSQASENKSISSHELAARDLVTIGSDITSFRSCVTAYMQLMATVFQSTVESIEESSHLIPSAFVHYLTSLAPSEFCTCRPVLRLIFSSYFPLLAADADILFDHLASEFLEVYDYERHEVALTIELDLLQGCASQWTDTDAGSLKESATEAYRWFINVALAKSLCSPDVQLGIADLFFTLLRVRGPDFKPDATLPSVRTGLFGLLGTGEIRIKYHISEHIAQFFGHFTLGEHEAVFDDVHKNLPEAVTWKEGMALRLLVLSRLGSHWNTLLRRCVYHIYETAGMVEQCSGHATFCIATIASSLSLESSQELFRLFASQLLFTWLGLRSVDEIPYIIFSYASLGSLLNDVQDEVFSQVLMRSKDGDITALSVKLESSTSDLLKKNFGKAAGYCLAWDTNKISSQGQQSWSETKLRALIDKTEYGNLCRQHLSSILATFLYTIDEEPQMLKTLSKRPNTAQQFNALKNMQEISASGQTLPADQQPLFRSKFLIDRIDRLARRVNVDPSVLWNPAVYTFVLRMLLSKIHSALGSLHACSVVRKVRIIIALSGSVAFSGYPLEMTLHALRPLLTDKQCADDALGVVQYLFGNGIAYLSSQISFVSGVVVSMLISIRKFVGSSQESTTQESQHRATMTKAHSFHNWLVDSWMVDYAKHYGKSDATLQTCIALVKAASKANAKASPMSGTAESEILLQLLIDRRSGRNILKGPAWDLAFSLLCSDFAVAPSYRNDILGHDTQAAAFASEVWASCRYTNVSREYLLWAARVLGRAHNAAGLTSTFIGSRKASDLTMTESEPKKESSKSAVLRSLSTLLFSSERNEVGLAEETIRAVLQRTTSRQEVAENSELLLDSTIMALTLMTTEVAVPIGTPESLPLERCIIDATRPVGEWVRNLTVSLSSAAQDEPLVGALPRILAGVKHLAEALFAPILHLVLDGDHHGSQKIRQIISEGCRELFKGADDQTLPQVKTLLNAVLYLHKQPFPQESNINDRLRWLDIDYAIAAKAAEKCSMHTTALLFAEQSAALSANVKTSRRSSVPVQISIPDDLLLSIFKSIDEPDSFYGVQQTPDLFSVLDRLEYEADGFKGLLFRGARLDSQIRRHDDTSAIDSGGLIRSLINLNLNALPHTLLSNQHAFIRGINTTDSVLYTARKLEQWDIRAPETTLTESSTIFKIFQGINNSRDLGAVRHRLDSGFFGTIHTLISPIHTGQSVKSCLRTLGILVEVDDVMTSISPEHLRDAWSNMQARSEKMLSAQ